MKTTTTTTDPVTPILNHLNIIERMPTKLTQHDPNNTELTLVYLNKQTQILENPRNIYLLRILRLFEHYLPH